MGDAQPSKGVLGTIGALVAIVVGITTIEKNCSKPLPDPSPTTMSGPSATPVPQPTSPASPSSGTGPTSGSLPGPQPSSEQMEAERQALAGAAQRLEQHDSDVRAIIEKHAGAYREVAINNKSGQVLEIAVAFTAVDNKLEVKGWLQLPIGESAPLFTTSDQFFYAFVVDPKKGQGSMPGTFQCRAGYVQTSEKTVFKVGFHSGYEIYRHLDSSVI